MKHFCSWVGSRKYYIFTIVVYKNIVQIRRVNNFVHKKITFSNAILSDNHFIYFASSCPLNVTLVKPLRQRQFCNYVTLLFNITKYMERQYQRPFGPYKKSLLSTYIQYLKVIWLDGDIIDKTTACRIRQFYRLLISLPKRTLKIKAGILMWITYA